MPPLSFEEEQFVLALTNRDEDARRLSRIFKSDWLSDKSLVPIVDAIYAFTKEHGISPSVDTLHEYMKGEDEDIYAARWKSTLDRLGIYTPDQSRMILAIEKAKEYGSSLALDSLIQSETFKSCLEEGDGKNLIRQVQGFLNKWTEEPESEGVLNIRDAFGKLLDEHKWLGRPDRISCGILPIDDWTNNGLRPHQLGILMAPTGGGKSAALLNIAHHAATIEQLPVLMITNELTLNEQSERFLVRMQRPRVVNGSPVWHTLQEVQDDPAVAYRGLGRRWVAGLEKRLYLCSVDINQTADDIEELLKRLRLEEGFVPALIVIDYMERMSPRGQSVSKEKEWIYLGEIAKDLVRAAKRTNTLIWTAVQTNRAGLSKGADLDMTMGQGSIRQFQEAAFVGAMQKITVPVTMQGEQDVPCIKFSEQKQRHNANENRAVLVKHELSRMFISKDIVEVPNDADKESDDSGMESTDSNAPISPFVASRRG